jgi:predicted Zn-dependent protease
VSRTATWTLVLFAALAPAARSQEAPPPDDARARFTEAQKRHLAGETEAARALLKELLDADPKNFELALSIARWLCIERQDYAGAEPFARRAAELEARSAEAVNLLGSCLNSSGRAEEAETVFRAGAKRFEADGTMRFGLGMACALQLKYLEARDAYDQAIALEPRNGLYRFSSGECRANLREFEAAEKELRLAVEWKGHADARWRLGEVLARQGKEKEAEETLRAAMLEGPKLARFNAALQLGILLFEHGRAEECARLLHQATKQRPEGRDAWMWLARAERALGHEEAATRALRRYQELRASADKAEEERLLDLIKAQLAGSGAKEPPAPPPKKDE